MWKRLALSAALLPGLAGVALACGGYTLPMGALRLAYDPAVWTAADVAPNHWRLTPRDDGEGATIDAIIGDSECSESAMAARVNQRFSGHRKGSTTNAQGLTIVWAEGYTGCRNLTAGPVAACVRERGRTWLFATEPQGCSLTRYGKAEPLELLAGLGRDRGPVAR